MVYLQIKQSTNSLNYIQFRLKEYKTKDWTDYDKFKEIHTYRNLKYISKKEDNINKGEHRSKKAQTGNMSMLKSLRKAVYPEIIVNICFVIGILC